MVTSGRRRPRASRAFAARAGERVGAESGYPGGSTSDLLVDRDGAVWAATTSGVFVLPRAGNRFEWRASSLDPSSSGVGILRQTPDGSIWAASKTLGLTRLADASGIATPPAPAAAGLDEAWGLLLDSRGSVWVMNATAGLEYVPFPAPTRDASVRPDAEPPLHGTRVPLASRALVSSLPLEDREGSVGGNQRGARALPRDEAHARDLPAADHQTVPRPGVDGAVWVGPVADPLLVVSDRGSSVVLDRDSGKRSKLRYIKTLPR
jgi:hypothetical protein